MMTPLVLTLTLLCCFGTYSALRCPEEGKAYADFSSDCEMYHICENSDIKTFTCPSGQAFDSRTSKCENASTVTCNEILEPFTALQTTEHVRSKRQVLASDVLYKSISSFVRPMINSWIKSLLGSSNTLAHKVILPTIYEMLDYAPSRRDLFFLVISVKFALAPIALEMFSHQIMRPGAVTVQIPRELVHNAFFKLIFQTKPILGRLMQRHFNNALRRVFANLPVVVSTVIRLGAAKFKYMIPLKQAIFQFVQKHGNLLKSSTATHLNFYSMPQIIQDLMPIKNLLFKIAIEYLRQNPQSIVNKFYGELNPVQNQYGGMLQSGNLLNQFGGMLQSGNLLNQFGGMLQSGNMRNQVARMPWALH